MSTLNENEVKINFGKHPETKEGEIFIGNSSEIIFDHSVKWQSKRMGETAYNIDGIAIKGLYPVFAKKEEIIKVLAGYGMIPSFDE